MATMMTSKGRVTVPKTVREFLGVGPGSTIDFELMLNGEVVTRAAATGRRPQRGRCARSRGRVTVKLCAGEILALTRGA